MTITVSINGGTPLNVFSPAIVPVVVDAPASTPIFATAVGVAGPAGPTGPAGADGGGLSNVVEDTTPQLGGDLDAQTNNITNLGSLNGTAASTIISGAAAGATALQNVVEDTSPQLGGTLDTQNNPINSSSGVSLQHNGSTKLSTYASGVRTSGTVSVNSAYTLPTSDGDAGQVLQTDGSGSVTFQTASSGISNVVEDTTPQLGGNLDVNAKKIVSTSNGDIDIEPNGTGDVLLGNFKFDADQSVGAGQDNYVLTYDNSAGKISLEAAAGGSSYIHMYGSANNGNSGADRYIPLGGNSTDTSSLQVYSEGMCPFAGVVESITVRTDNAAGSTTTKLWVNGSAVNSSSDTLSANTPLTIAFGDSVSTGDLIACSMNTTNAAGDSYVTVLIKKS